MRLHYKIREGEKTIQYVDVTILYPYIYMYFKFPVGHSIVHAGEACRDTNAMLDKELGKISCILSFP